MQKKVNNYDELRKWVGVFNTHTMDILIVEGSAGAGKSSMVKESLAGKTANRDYLWLEGRLSAVCFYEKLYAHRDVPIYIDDVDGLYRDKEAINLLKCLCQTWEEKTITWQTKTMARSDIPDEFTTKSKVCIITNSWKNLNKHVGAVQDRGLLVLFHPDAEEVHRYAKEKLSTNPDVWDEEVYDFIGQNLNIIAEPSIRHYVNARRLKNAETEWKEVLIESFGLTDNAMAVLKLQELALSHNQRAALFAAEQKKSERTYWRTKADLEAKGIDFSKE